jgi:type VI secretion system secreted protein VgrG
MTRPDPDEITKSGTGEAGSRGGTINMKTLFSIGSAAALVVVLAGTALAAPAAIGLGTAGTFAVLAGTTVTNTGPTTITGDVGLSPGSALTGFGSVTLHGTQHVADAVALGAQNDLVTAYTTAAGATPVTAVPTELGGTTHTAGVYGSATLGLTGTLTLDAQGNAAAVFVFQAASTLITAPASKVVLTNGASACNVFWQVGSSATLDTTTSFRGTILALTSIALKTGATLEGRALARNGAVTLDTNTITTGTCAASGTGATASPGATIPATDTVAATQVALAQPISVFDLLILVSGAIAFALAVRSTALRSRPRG